MAAKPRRIKDKLLHEAYTPAESDEDGYSDGVDYAVIVGNKRFHSFQVWREKAGEKPTYVYGLTLKQIAAIRAQADVEISAKNAELMAEIETVQKALSELKTQTAIKGATLEQEVERLRYDKLCLSDALKQLQQKMRNYSPSTGGQSIRATSIPMGGAPGYRLKSKRR
ncbi:MAG: hypothetical protein U1E84_08690 [Rhodoferax sp.]